MRFPLLRCVSIAAAVLCAGVVRSTDLHDAVNDGALGEVEKVLRSNPSLVNIVNEGGETPLQLACRKGSIDIAGLLIDAGADLDAANNRGMTPLRWAIQSHQVEIVRLLLERGAATGDIHPMFGSLIDQAFSTACQRKAGPEIVGILIATGLEFDAARVDAMGMSRLDWAAHFSNISMTQFAIKHGADVNLVSQRLGRAPLIAAVKNGNAELVDILLNSGADVSLADREGNPPIRYAVERGRTAILEKLLDRGAPVDCIDTADGWTLMHLAAIKGYSDIAAILASHGCAIDTPDSSGRTPLLYAAEYGNSDAAELLIEHGAARPDGLMENYGKPAWLTDELSVGRAVTCYLNHRGWAMKSPNHLLIFDAEEFGVRRPDNPGFVNGFLDPEELRGQNILAVYSCYHGQPGEPAFIHSLADSLNRIAFVHLSDDAWRGSPNTAYLTDKADTTIGGIAVRSISPTGYMPSLAYLLTVDDMTVYYQAFGTDDLDKLSRDHRFLAGAVDTIDIAFLPIPEPGTENESDLKLFLEMFPTRAVCLHDTNRRERLFPEIAQQIARWGFNTEIFCAEHPGDQFVFSADK
ncbi:MAG: ankyrin repeat domain-containing protein [Candidatus Zixiibacteriota bacterium]|nr:MAG: ankyrin repeat domain-containing protein [candidate division Zixibacteria bacterium]